MDSSAVVHMFDGLYKLIGFGVMALVLAVSGWGYYAYKYYTTPTVQQNGPQVKVSQ